MKKLFVLCLVFIGIQAFAQKYSVHKGGFAIPQYLYVNEKGEVVSSDAPRPSDPEELKALLQK